MPLPTRQIAAAQPYRVALTFAGIATYKILEYVANDQGGWDVNATIQKEGHSTDAQADAYDLPAVGKGQRRLIWIGANMASVTGDTEVAMTATFRQAGKDIYVETAKGTEKDGGLVSLVVRCVFEGGQA